MNWWFFLCIIAESKTPSAGPISLGTERMTFGSLAIVALQPNPETRRLNQLKNSAKCFLSEMVWRDLSDLLLYYNIMRYIIYVDTYVKYTANE